MQPAIRNLRAVLRATFRLNNTLPGLLAFLFGAGLSVYGFVAWREAERADADLAFRNLASQHLDDVRRDIQKSVNAIAYVGTLFEASSQLDPAVFAHFADAVIKNNPSVEQIAWVPAVTSSATTQIPRYVAPAQEIPLDLDRGQRDGSNMIDILIPRDHAPSRPLTNQDAAFDPTDQFRFRLLLPVQGRRDGQVAPSTFGYVSGVFGFFRNTAARPPGLMTADPVIITIVDQSAPAGQQWLYPANSDRMPDNGGAITRTCIVGTHLWLITAFSRNNLAMGNQWQSAVFLASGLAISAALAHYLVVLSRRRRLGEALIRRSTWKMERALLRLKLSDERFRDYVTTASDWYWETDAEYRFTVVAEGATHFGIDRTKLIGLARLTEAEDPAWADSRLEVLSKHVPFRGLRYEYPQEDGELNLSLNGLPIFNEDGSFRGFRGSASDITAQLKAEAAQLDALWAAEQNNRAKSNFLANMSHEIRTPMNGVLGMVQILRHTELNTEQRRMCEVIYQSGNGLLTILNDILDYSKLEAGKIQMEAIACPLTDLIESVFVLLQHTADAKAVTLDYEAPPGPLPQVLVDPTRLRQVLLNLVSNAIKFSHRGTVTVRLQAKRVDPAHLAIELAVTDQGIGMSPEAQSRLFQRFNQADPSATRLFGGTGLGLAITHELVALMGGKIAAQSTLGVGSSFIVSLTLPIASDADIPEVAEAYVPPKGPVATLDLLVAEDDEINQVVIRRFLEGQGHAVTLAANGEEAIEAAQAHRFDLVLMDMMMPITDGITATRRIRQLPPPQNQVPIIALTANAMAGDRDKYLAAGMNGYVSKPIDRVILFQTMEQLLGVRVSKSPPPAAAAQAAPPPPPEAASQIEDFIASLEF